MSLPNDSDFLLEAGRLINSGQSNSLILHGNVHDLFEIDLLRGEGTEYVNLTTLIIQKWGIGRNIVLRYELNGLIQIPEDAEEALNEAWDKLRGINPREGRAIKEMLGHQVAAQPTPTLTARIRSAVGDSLKALEILRQITLCSRRGHLDARVIILIDNADAIIPDGPLPQLSEQDRFRVCKLQEWFSEPSFANGTDTVILIAEAQSLINQRVAKLPQVLSIKVPAPDEATRKDFIQWFNATLPEAQKLKRSGMNQGEIAALSAGLSLYALQQLLKDASYRDAPIHPIDVINKVESHIIDLLGDDVIEFKKPEHRFKDVVGFSQLKTYLQSEFIPRIRSAGPEALTGAAVAGPIGSGKTFVFEAVAGELGIVVMTLKNIRSQWFGQTDVLFEKLRQVLDAVGRALIFIDEADTQLGGVGKNDHATERRLTGKIQSLMSDPKMRGKVTWLLITARIHLLSPDIRRPGRAGSLIIPVLDPTGGDQRAFLQWALKGNLTDKLSELEFAELIETTAGYSAAEFANLRSELKHQSKGLSKQQILDLIDDMIPPAIAETRRFQTLQALINCTRKSLLNDPENYTAETRLAWQQELRQLEAAGIE